MAKRYDDAQRLTATVYGEARRRMLATLGKHLDKLDSLYGQDAAALKSQLRAMLGLSGVPARRVNKLVDDIVSQSRQARFDVLASAVRDGAKHARNMDEDTYRAVFEGQPETPPPKAQGASGSSPTPMPRLQLVDASEDDPQSTT